MISSLLGRTNFWVPTEKCEIDNLYCIGKFLKSVIKVNKDQMLKYEGLKQNDLFSTIKRNAISAGTITVLAHRIII